MINLFFLFLLCADVDDTVQFNLANNRNVKGFILENENSYIINLKFIAVNVFDKNTNDDINIDMGREFAIEGLHLTKFKQKSCDYIIRNSSVIKSGYLKNDFELSVKIPKSGIEFVDNKAKFENKNSPNIRKTSPPELLTVKEDYLDYIKFINSKTMRILDEIVNNHSKFELKEIKNQLYKLEEKSSEQMDNLTFKIKSDIRLTDIAEKPELIEFIKKTREKTENLISAKYENLKLRLKKSSLLENQRNFLGLFSFFFLNNQSFLIFQNNQLSSIEFFDKNFEKIYFSNPKIFNSPNTIILNLNEKTTVVIGIARINRDKIEDDSMASEMGILKANVQISKDLKGSDVSYFKKVQENLVLIEGEVKTNELKREIVFSEKFKSHIQFAPLVATWESADKKYSFYAVGRFINSK